VDNGGCPKDSICNHDTKDVKCLCKPGFVAKGKECVDACTVNNGNCAPQADCSHVGDDQSVACKCKPGYVGNGLACADICTYNNGGCVDVAKCTHDSTTNAVKCICPEQPVVRYNGVVQCDPTPRTQ
jgi:hypothetical protein